MGPVPPAVAQEKPNIIFIMGDDIGWSNIGVYNQGCSEILSGGKDHGALTTH